MTGRVARRLLAIVPLWIGISAAAFALIGLADGDPAAILLQRRTGEMPSETAVAEMRREMGLDDPIPVRYARWLAGALRGDLGTSLMTGEPVLASLLERFPATLLLAAAAMALAVAVGIPLGVATALGRGSLLDHGARISAVILASMPGFWVGYLLILAFPVALGVLPVGGMGGPRHLVLPAVTLAIGMVAVLSRLTRASVLEELDQDYVRTARAKGLPRRGVVAHAVRNAWVAVVTIGTIRFGHLLAGAVIIETVFAWPGIGTWVIDSIHDRDYPAIQGFVLFTATVFLLLNAGADALHAWLDPRVRGRSDAG